MRPENCFGEGERLVETCANLVEQERFIFKGQVACATCVGELRQQAETDYLTGLPNERVLAKRFEELRAGGRPFGALSFDLINFKLVNERFGHPVGDKVLKFTADFFNRSRRQDDTLTTRSGGDEFIMLATLDSTPGESGKRTAHLTPELRLATISSRYTTNFARVEQIMQYNESAAEDGQLGLRAAAAKYEEPMDLEDLLVAADPKGNDENGATEPNRIESMLALFSEAPRLP